MLLIIIIVVIIAIIIVITMIVFVTSTHYHEEEYLCLNCCEALALGAVPHLPGVELALHVHNIRNRQI